MQGIEKNGIDFPRLSLIFIFQYLKYYTAYKFEESERNFTIKRLEILKKNVNDPRYCELLDQELGDKEMVYG